MILNQRRPHVLGRTASGSPGSTSDKGPEMTGGKLKIPARETAALFESWLNWLPHFIRQETANSAGAGDPLERAFILATIRASQDVYKQVPGEEEMERGTSILARKLNQFYGLARETYLNTARDPAPAPPVR
jgi:hypothetical protein